MHSTATHQVLTVGLYGDLESLAAGRKVLVDQDRAAIILDAQIHRACMQVHAAVELMLSVVEAHKVLPRGKSVVTTVIIPDLPWGGLNQ